MCSAIRRRTPRSAPASLCRAGAARHVLLGYPALRPRGVDVRRSTPSCCATFRISGVARTRVGSVEVGGCGAGAGSARGSSACGTAPSPMTTRMVPTGTTFPSSTRMLATFPAAGEDLDRRLVGLHLDERVVLGDLLALLDEPAGDLPLGETLAEIRQLELVGHQCLFR